MPESEWKESLAKCFEELRIIEEYKGETPEHFKQFCEFIAEPAFESLAKELRKYGVKSKSRRIKSKLIAFQVNFPKSRVDNFYYMICLPKGSYELRLKLRIRGRRNKKSVIEEKELPFMKDVLPSDILKLKKEDLIMDVIKHFRNFNFDAMTKLESKA
jgi:hypothetical protein